MKSVAFELNKLDLKKFMINVIKYVILPDLTYILAQLQLWSPIDRKILVIWPIGMLMDMFHRWASDNTISLWANSDTPPTL